MQAIAQGWGAGRYSKNPRREQEEPVIPAIRALSAFILGSLLLLALASLQPSRALAQGAPLPGPTYLQTLGGPEDLVVTDLNGDSVPDLLLAGTRSGILVIHEGLGGGEFGLAEPYSVSGQPFRVVAGDLDRDGLTDLAWIDEVAGTLHWTYAEAGEGIAYTGGGVQLEGEETSGLLLTDLDGDGWLDAVVSVGGADQLAIHLNDGAGSFKSAQFHRVGDRPEAMLVTEHPQTGLPRLIVAQSGALSRNLAVYDGLPPQLQQQLATGRPVGIQLMQWDDDALSDLLVVAQDGSRLQVHGARSDGSFVPLIDVPTDPGSVSAVEIDRIGSLRRVVVGEADRDRVSLYEGLPDETLTRRQSWFVGRGFHQVVGADLDGNGRKEILVPIPENNSIAVLEQAGAGLMAFSSVVAGVLPREMCFIAEGAQHPARVAVLDEVANTIHIFEPHDGSLHEVRKTQQPQASEGIEWAYLDDDGFPDLISIRENLGLQILYADASGGFLPAQLLDTGGQPVDFSCGDVDADGHVDLAVADAAAFSVRIFLGDGAGGFTETAGVSSAVPPRIVKLADLDLDQRADLLMLDGTNFLSIFFNNVGGFTTPVRTLTGTDPRELHLGYITPDPYPDIVVILASSDGGYTSLLSTAPRAYFLAALVERFESGYSPTSLADVSGDGAPDLVLAPIGGQGVALRQGSDDGKFGTQFPVIAATLVLALEAGDVDGDGTTDVILLDGITRCLHILLQEPNPLVAVAPTLRAIRSEEGVLLVVEGARAQRVVRLRDGSVFEPGFVREGRFEAWDRYPQDQGESYSLVDDAGQELDRASVSSLPAGETVIRLAAPAPNPGHDQVQIRFRAPRGASIALRVIDARGRVVSRLPVAEGAAGWYTSSWQGRDDGGAVVARGRYHVDLQVDGRRLSRSLVWMGN
jgi:hypothetical protein